MASGHIGQITDAEVVRMVRREMARFCIDTSETIVSSMHGIVHLNGRVRPIRGHEDEFSDEVLKVPKVVRQRPGIRDVIVEWDIPDGYKKFGSTSNTRSR